MLSRALRKRAFSTVKPGSRSSDNILSRGGSEEPMDLFKRFRGCEPQLDAMLEHYGIKG
ncbi:M3 family metallopeptidase [Escherichia coli]